MIELLITVTSPRLRLGLVSWSGIYSVRCHVKSDRLLYRLLFLQLLCGAEIFDVAHGVVVFTEQQVGGADGLAEFDRVGDRAGRARGDGHRKKSLVGGQSVGQAE